MNRLSFIFLHIAFKCNCTCVNCLFVNLQKKSIFYLLTFFDILCNDKTVLHVLLSYWLFYPFSYLWPLIFAQKLLTVDFNNHGTFNMCRTHCGRVWRNTPSILKKKNLHLFNSLAHVPLWLCHAIHHRLTCCTNHPNVPKMRFGFKRLACAVRLCIMCKFTDWCTFIFFSEFCFNKHILNTFFLFRFRCKINALILLKYPFH